MESCRSPAHVPHTCAVSPTFRYGAFSFVAFALADSWSARLTSPAYPPGAKRSRRRRTQCGVQIRRALLSRNRRVAHPDLVESLHTLLLRRDNRTARLCRFRRAWPLQRLNRRRRVRRVVKPRHNLDIERHRLAIIVFLVGRDLRYPPSQRRAAKRALCGVRAVSYGSFSTTIANALFLETLAFPILLPEGC